VRIVHKILSFTIALLIFITVFIEVCRAEVSLGIWPAEIGVNAYPHKTTVAEIYVFNPGDSNVKAKIEFYCENCERDIGLFKHKIGTVTYEPDIDVNPSVLVAKENTSPFNPEKVDIIIHNPFWMKKHFKTSLFGKEVSIPFYGITFDRNEFEGKIIVTTIETKIALSITNKTKINVYGINKFIFIISILLIIFLISLTIQEYYKRKALKHR
jgi:hypothetical protein